MNRPTDYQLGVDSQEQERYYALQDAKDNLIALSSDCTINQKMAYRAEIEAINKKIMEMLNETTTTSKP